MTPPEPATPTSQLSATVDCGEQATQRAAAGVPAAATAGALAATAAAPGAEVVSDRGARHSSGMQLLPARRAGAASGGPVAASAAIAAVGPAGIVSRGPAANGAAAPTDGAALALPAAQRVCVCAVCVLCVRVFVCESAA
jgi:hypothetical protein